jgi:hypothetical protein
VDAFVILGGRLGARRGPRRPCYSSWRLPSMNDLASTPAVVAPRTLFRLQIIAVEVDGHEWLMFGEAVQQPIAIHGGPESTSETVPGSGTPVSLRVLRETIDEAQLASITGQLGSGSLVFGGMRLKLAARG